MIITIDGPAGTGKTTVAKKVAEKLHFSYFDTGAMYRAVSLALLERNIPLSDLPAIEQLLKEFSFHIREVNGQKRYFAFDKDVTDEIRSQKVNAIVSQVAALAPVRAALTAIQRTFALEGNSVFEGRDMGTAVFPYADIKVFLNARPEVRAQRRLDEMMAKMPEEAKDLDHDKILKDLMRRDDIDSTRELAPLRCPEDAIQIDTSNLSIDEVVKLILKHVKKTQKEMLRPGFLQHHMAFFYRFILFIAWLIFKIFYRMKAYGLEHFYRGPGIIASNHVSYYDPEILAVCWPEEVHFLARRTLFSNPLFGWFIRSLNAHPITGEPGDITVFKEILELLKQRKKIILFPEGSRAETDELAPLKPGIGLLITRSQSAVIPAYIHGAFKVWPPTQKMPKLFGKIVCVFGTPLRYEHFAHLDKKEAQKAITEALEKSILALKKWYLDGAKGTPP